MAAGHEEYMQDLKVKKLMLQENVQLLAELKAQLAASQKSYSLAEIQLKCMTESYKSLQTRVEENKCLGCASNSSANNDINTGKDTELAAAEKKLAECQETLYVLGRQLQAMCPQIGLTMSHHSKRLQMNEMLVKPTHGWSNAYEYCNSDEIDQAEACSISSHSDIQGVTDEFSSHNFGSSSCLSDTEGNFSLNSSIGSSQPGTESNFCSSASATGKHAHGLSHFFSSKEKTNH
ncbi:Filament-like plant protein [Sesbania bispinosa]|nr:Filament-like plant protein [Sesbania bispinosa]